MNPSIYSILSTFLSFFVLITYYYYYQPDFVMVESDNSSNIPPTSTVVVQNQLVFSLRLAIVYSLLFSSIIGLFVLCFSQLLKNYEMNTKIEKLDKSLAYIDRSYVESSLLSSSSESI